MAQRTSGVVSEPGFIADHASITRNDGRQVDWAAVNAAFIDAATGKKRLPAGTPVGETSAGGKIAERVVTTRPAIGLLATDAVEGDRVAALSGYGVLKGGVIYKDLLPVVLPVATPVVIDATTISELNAAGTGFAFERYTDDSAS